MVPEFPRIISAVTPPGEEAKPAIVVRITHPTLQNGPIQGFRFFWGFYVSGFIPSKHCQPCFRGKRTSLHTASAASGVEYRMDEIGRFPYLYVCGVAAGPKKERGAKNLHLPMEYAEGARFTVTTYNGYTVEVHNGRVVETPELPAGWMGRNEETTRCKNFRFAVRYFGYPDDSATPDGALRERQH